MKKLTFLFCVVQSLCFSQPVIEWQKNFGGSETDISYDSHINPDGSIVFAGITASNDNDVTGNHGLYDGWVLKLDAVGNIIWQKCIGGSQTEDANTILQTSDGGYIIAANSNSIDGQVTGNHGGFDVWMVKLDNLGNLLWQKSMGGSADDWVKSLTNTIDGGFILAGYTFSTDGDVTVNNGGYDYWVVKFDINGIIEWQKTFGGSSYDYAELIQLTLDGGYIVTGNSFSNDGDVTNNHGGYDYWVVKLDDLGIIQWQKSLGGSGDDYAKFVQPTSDGGYLITGDSQSNDVDVSGNHGGYDCWVVKLDSQGNLIWQKSMGGSSDDNASELIVNQDGSYQMVGSSSSSDGDLTGVFGQGDIWLVKFVDQGIILNQKTLGGFNGETGQSIDAYVNGGILLTGGSVSNDHDVCNNFGLDDFWVVKLNDCASPLPTSSQEICSVGLDSLTNKNRIVWEKPLDVGIDSFYVYKEIATGIYSKIGAVDNCENGVFIDVNSVPIDSSYSYKIAVLGMCGDTSALSSTAHETVKLEVFPGAGGVFNLSWNPYVGFPYSTYNLYRGSDPSNIVQLATLPNTAATYQDNTPPAGALFYQIEVVNPNDCDPTKINGYGVSRSNIANNGIAALNDEGDISFSIVPNPTNGDLTLKVAELLIGKVFQLMDGYGRVLMSGTVNDSNQLIQTSELSVGTYYLKIESLGVVKRIVKQ